MMMLGSTAHILIVDDEPLARMRLQKMCEKLSAEEGEAGESNNWVIAEAANGQDCIDYCEQQDDDNKVDLVFLDIEMPGVNGLQAAERLQTLDTPPAIVFCTAYSEFALQAFDAAAIDYLLKPVEYGRLKEAMQKASLIQAARLQQVKQLLGTTDEEAEGQKLPLQFIWAKSNRSKQRVDLAEVRILQADSKYVSAITPEGSYLLDISLKQLEDQLDDCFIRVHRSTLINTRYLSACEKNEHGEYHVYLEGVDASPAVSRRLQPSVQAWIKQQSS